MRKLVLLEVSKTHIKLCFKIVEFCSLNDIAGAVRTDGYD